MSNGKSGKRQVSRLKAGLNNSSELQYLFPCPLWLKFAFYFSLAVMSFGFSIVAILNLIIFLAERSQFISLRTRILESFSVL
jgi:hypothetical protein